MVTWSSWTHSCLLQGSCIRWSLKISSNPKHSATLWLRPTDPRPHVAWWKPDMELQSTAGWKQPLVTDPPPVLVLYPTDSEGNDTWKTTAAEKNITQTGKAKCLHWVTSAFLRQDTKRQESFWKNKFVVLVDTTKVRPDWVFIGTSGKNNVRIYSYVYTQQHFEPEKSAPANLWIPWKT